MNRKKQTRKIALLLGIALILTSTSTGTYLLLKKYQGSTLNQQKEEQPVNPSPQPNPIPKAESPPEDTDDDEPPEPQQPETPPTKPAKPTPTPTTPPKQPNWWDYPSTIVTIPSSEVTLTTVVDKGHKLSSDYVPPNLVLVQGIPGIRINKTIYLRSELIEPLKKLGAKAQKDGVDLSIASGYRSYATQVSTYNYWVQYNGGNAALADQVSARPGHSEHQLGTVVDFSSAEAGDSVGAHFHNTAAAKWLAQNAPAFGFSLSYPAGKEAETGYAYESWHWRWR